MDLEEALAPYLTVTTVIVRPIASLTALFFVYGIYTIIFGLAIRVLCRRDAQSSRLYLGGTIALFLLGTLFVSAYLWTSILSTVIFYKAVKAQDLTPMLEYLRHNVQKTATGGIMNLVYDLMNALADLMLIHRCYIIWDSNKFVLYLLAFLSFVLNGITIGCEIPYVIATNDTSSLYNVNMLLKTRQIIEAAAFGITGFNLLLTFMTGGRIWWISREARKLMGQPTHSKYKATVAIIIESGILYAGFMLVAMVYQRTMDPETRGAVAIDLGALTTLMAGLAPTLIIVRAAHGKSVSSVNQMMSLQMQFADPQLAQQKSTILGVNVDFHSRATDDPAATSTGDSSERLSDGLGEGAVGEKMV
ncbi:hypothetical protein PM082_023508 [Marasmius tenuissimus]|nr:hypothetical protein PM082_023508 [Marasmius tenuissimus]